MGKFFKFYILFFILVTELSAQVTWLNGWNVFLDAGHSQNENMGIYGYSEAERNLRVALRLREMLLETTDIDTVFICRTNDNQQVSLSQRTSYANSLGAAWYHSIHSNAGASDRKETLLLWGQYYNSTEKVPNGGKAMSAIMIDILTRGMRTTTIGSWGDCSFYTWSTWCQTSGGPYLHVNRVSTMPSELSESGYHTNPIQNQMFMSDRWKILEAKTFYWTFLKFFGIERPYVGAVSGIIKDEDTNIPINGAFVTTGVGKDTTDSFESLFHKYSNNPEQLHNGFYYIEDVSDEEVQLIVEAEGYYSDTLQVTPSDTFFTFQDIRLVSKILPTIVATTPAQGDSNITAWAAFILEFNRKMDRESVVTNLQFSPDVKKTFYWSNNDSKLIIRTDTLQYLTDYSITIPGTAVDNHGHLFDGDGDGIGGDDYVLNFTTGTEDRKPPSIDYFYPEYSATDVENFPIIRFTFDEIINPTSVTQDIFKLKQYSTATFVETNFEHYVVRDQSVLCYFPMEPLESGEKYLGRIYSGITDVFGNISGDSESISFTTTNKNYSQTVIETFENDFTDYWWDPNMSGSTSGILPDSTSRAANSNYTNPVTQSNSSLQINYGWNMGTDSWLIRLYLNESSPKNRHFDKNNLLQVYLFGDGSGNLFRFCLDDKVPNYAAANHEVSPWYEINWIGWKLVSWDMASGSSGSWIGDGNLDGTLRFESIQMSYNPGSPTSGTIYVDDLHYLTEIPTGVEVDEMMNVVSDYKLKQNYPNPFNPETTIDFFIPVSGQVKISVYDLLGRKIKLLTDRHYNPGNFSISWDGKNSKAEKVTSGAYFYKMEANGFTDVKKMLLLE